jgi:hypothetical protein
MEDSSIYNRDNKINDADVDFIINKFKNSDCIIKTNQSKKGYKMIKINHLKTKNGSQTHRI